MPLYRKKGKYPTSNNVGSVCKSLPFRFWELFPAACRKVKATPADRLRQVSLMFNFEGSRFIIRVWGGKPHRFFRHENSRSEMPGDT